MIKTTFRNIVVSGDVGTGTTTLAKSLARKLGWKYLSAGDFFRAYQKKHGIPLWNKAVIPVEIEKKIDHGFFEKMKNERHIVFDSHYGGWFAKDLPDVLRILLICGPKIATRRILNREHTDQETPQEIEERRRQLREKFEKLYSGDDYQNPKYFHLVIDSSTTPIEQEIVISLNKLQSTT